MPVNTAVRAVVHSPGKALPLGLLCLRGGAFTLYHAAYSLRYFSYECHVSYPSGLETMYILRYLKTQTTQA